MLRSVAVTRIQDGLGFRPTLADKIILRLQEEQRDLERGKTLPQFLINANVYFVLLSGGNTFTLPTDFLRRTNKLLRYKPTGTLLYSQTVPWKEFDASFEVFGSSTPSGPKVAVLRPEFIRFFPAADQNYDMVWDYYKKDAVLSADIENLWLANAPELLIGGAGLRIAKDIRNDKAIALFGDMYKQARMTWFGETVVQEAEDGPLVLGSNA